MDVVKLSKQACKSLWDDILIQCGNDAYVCQFHIRAFYSLGNTINVLTIGVFKYNSGGLLKQLIDLNSRMLEIGGDIDFNIIKSLDELWWEIV